MTAETLQRAQHANHGQDDDVIAPVQCSMRHAPHGHHAVDAVVRCAALPTGLPLIATSPSLAALPPRFLLDATPLSPATAATAFLWDCVMASAVAAVAAVLLYPKLRVKGRCREAQQEG